MVAINSARLNGVLVVLVSAVILGAAPLSRGEEPVQLAAFPPTAPPSECGYRTLVAGTHHIYFKSGGDVLAADMQSRSVELLRDTRTGGNYGEFSWLMTAGDRLFFQATDGHVAELVWTSDATPAGTRLLYEQPTASIVRRVTHLTTHQGHLYFNGRDQLTGLQALYQSDGTEAGTRLLSRIADPGPMLSVAAGLVGGGRSGEDRHGTLWASDGTEAGTHALASFGTWIRVGAIARLGEGALAWVYNFNAPSGSPVELWRTDLTRTGTAKIADVDPPPSIATPAARWTAEAGGLLFFAAIAHGLSPGLAIWRTDGTAAGTFSITPAVEEEQQQDDVWRLGPAQFMAAAGPVLVFAGQDLAHGLELWASDGTQEGTHMLADINPGGISSNPEWLTSSGGNVYFAAESPGAGRELWRTDGTAAGTRRVIDLFPGSESAFRTAGDPGSADPGNPLVAFAGEIAFLGMAAAGECRLWTSDGTEAGTRAVGEALPPSSGWRSIPPTPPPIVAADGSVLAVMGNRGSDEAWVTDGTSGSFTPWSGPRLARILEQPLPRVHGQLLLNSAGKVVRTDLTPAGTVEAFPEWMDVASDGEDGVFYFWRNFASLWRSDGTPAGTKELRTFTMLPYKPAGRLIAQSGGTAYFFALDDAHGVEPWITDGTPAGTRLITDLCPGLCSESLHAVGAAGGFAYFKDWSGKCWVTDGTVDGTRSVVAAACGPQVLRLKDMVLYGVPESGASWSLYRARLDLTDVQYLRMVDNLSLTIATADGAPPELPVLFSASSPTSGVELWRTDGTRDGTTQVADLYPGWLSAAPIYLTQAFGRTYFTAADPEHGSELWSSDGSVEGTRLEADILPGPASAVPRGFAVAGNRLVFEVGRRDGTQEFWSFRASALPRVDAANATVGEGRLGDGSARVQITLSEPPAVDVSVAFHTEDGSATAGADYLPVSGRVTIPAGSQGPVTVVVPLVDDPVAEATEELFVLLSDPSGAVLGHGSATVTITDDGYGRPNPRRRTLRAAP